MNISPELWRQIDPLLTDALDMDDVARAAWLQNLDQTHPQLSPLVRKMLAAHDRAERSQELETVPRLASSPPTSSAFTAGQRVGPFSLVRVLGRGGMGEVWLANQADGRIEREVALKLPTVYLHSDVWRERLRRERDILAKLTHPNIAKLFDAGVSDEEGSRGQPYLALECIEGDSLIEFAKKGKLPITERLKLFQQILAAVAHAHHHLVVHRDLKPANILIDQSGQVKLLDFGIAKLIDDGDEENAAADLTQMGGRIMTLRYAAPEQVADGVISTGTDVYALGVILHELVTGLSPYRAVREGRAFKEAALLGEEIAVPSSLASLAMTSDAAIERKLTTAKLLSRQIAGDLDAIILKAMRKNPADRYASVDQFDADIQRHLDHRPVKAREGNWRYLAGRFAARYKLPVAAAAAVLLTTAIGVVMVERERRVAVAEKARAEKHFASVRKLANSFVFDVHSEIENLAGSLKARQVLVSTALKYLDSLAGESRDDPALALEVAGAYRKLAEIKGDVYSSYVGETASAKQSVERARAILESIGARQPDSIPILREQRVLGLLNARLLTDAGDSAALAETEKAVAIAEKIVRLPGAEVADRRNLGATLAAYGWTLDVVKSDASTAVAVHQRAIEILETLIRDNPGDMLSRANLAGAYARASIGIEINGKKDDLPRAIALMEKSIATSEALMRDDATNSSHLQALVKAYSNLASTLHEFGNLDAAGNNIAKAREAVKRLLVGEPGNVGYTVMQIRVLAVSSQIEYTRHRFEQAIDLARDAIAVHAHLSAEAGDGMHARANIAVARSYIGLARVELAKNTALAVSRRLAYLKEAREQFVLARAFRQELVDRKVDAQSALRLVGEISTEIRNCDAMIARLGGA
ncbi:MAG: serine/threonine protein kinase [Betaproteobacteria bacterium]|nr:serine/threonine protein kinase [Betaproteobacteria bacterium]